MGVGHVGGELALTLKVTAWPAATMALTGSTVIVVGAVSSGVKEAALGARRVEAITAYLAVVIDPHGLLQPPSVGWDQVVEVHHHAVGIIQEGMRVTVSRVGPADNLAVVVNVVGKAETAAEGCPNPSSPRRDTATRDCCGCLK